MLTTTEYQHVERISPQEIAELSEGLQRPNGVADGVHVGIGLPQIRQTGTGPRRDLKVGGNAR